MKLHKNMVELERLKRENAEKELQLVETELQSLNYKSELNEFKLSSKQSVCSPRQKKAKIGKFDGLSILVDKLDDMKKTNQTLLCENSKLQSENLNIDILENKVNDLEKSLLLKNERINLMMKNEELHKDVLENKTSEVTKLNLDLKLLQHELDGTPSLSLFNSQIKKNN
jgi:hypothetical protein